MNYLKYLIFFALVLVLTYFLYPAQSPKPNCYDVVYKLSSEDRCLNTRLQFKANIASETDNPEDFATLVKSSHYQCNGTYYSCGYTLSWISEIFEGLKDQFEEYKHYDDFNGTDSGFSTFYENIFRSYKNKP